MTKSLTELASQPNMKMWWSADRDTHEEHGRPTLPYGRVAYMVLSVDDVVPAYANLVFRAHRGCVEKYRDGKLVCPAEQGVQRTMKLTCSACTLCYRKDAVPSQVLHQLQGADCGVCDHEMR